jgi:hypothetical protein
MVPPKIVGSRWLIATTPYYFLICSAVRVPTINTNRHSGMIEYDFDPAIAMPVTSLMDDGEGFLG